MFCNFLYRNTEYLASVMFFFTGNSLRHFEVACFPAKKPNYPNKTTNELDL